MKINLSKKTLKKVLVGTTVINYILLIAYIFLILSATVIQNATFFVIAIPAYIFSKSWLLIIGFFGFEILLLIYYRIKNKEGLQMEEEESIDLEIEDIFQSPALEYPPVSEEEDIFEDINLETIEHEEITAPIPQSSQITAKETQPTLQTADSIEHSLFDVFSEEDFLEQEASEVITESALDTEKEKEYDKLWQEAIKHVSLIGNKKKDLARKPLAPSETGTRAKKTQNDFTTKKQSNNKAHTQEKATETPLPDNHYSRALATKDDTHATKKRGNPSIIKQEHREFYNEIALNNWIYGEQKDRDRIGKYKMALDESRFREKDIEYLLEARVLFKIPVPHPTGSFTVYSVFEREDTKITKNYLRKLCRNNKLNLSEKTVSLKEHESFGLAKKLWRFDFLINEIIFGTIWISEFLLFDKETKSCTLTLKAREELKALQVAAQTIGQQSKPIIVTDYEQNSKIIEKYIKRQGKGEVLVVPIVDKKFEKKFVNMVRKLLSE